MARSHSNRGRSWRSRRANTVYLVLAAVLFALIVLILFRGHSSDPQTASAGAGADQTNPAADRAESAPALAAQVAPSRESVPSESVATAGAEDVPPTSPQDAEQTSQPPGDENARAAAIIAEALALSRSQPGSILEVRNKLNGALELPLSEQQRQTVKEELSKLADDWLFGPAVFAGDRLCDTYTVKPGDLLQVIGRRHKVPYEILMQINNIRRPQNLQAGRALKVVNGPFHAKVHRSTFTLDLYLQDVYVRSFKVGLGAPGTETPTGLWRVQEGGKLVQPPWYDKVTNRTYRASDPDYPLGSRWVALDGVDGEARGRTGFAIHGTKDPEQIGTAGSRGCIRMFNGDAILIYNLLVPLYSKVEVLE